jgi:hypothetical protein
MNLGKGMGLLAATLLGAIASWMVTRPQAAPAALVVSQAGRDEAVIRMLQEARKSVYLRTESLALVPAGNELAQAVQRKVSVMVELPLASGMRVGDSRLSRILMNLGAIVSFKSDVASNYRGTYLVVDGNQFLYSATPLTLSPPGAMVSFVSGPTGLKIREVSRERS